jgi:AraC-like DNA-binding protein
MTNSFQLAGLALIVLLLSVVLGKKKKTKADSFLIVFLAFEAGCHVYFLIEDTDPIQHSYWMLLGKGLYLLDSPLFFLYVFALTHNGNVPQWLYKVLFIPWILYALHFFYFYWFVFPSPIDVSTGLVYINEKLSWSWLMFSVAMLVIEPAYLIWFYRMLKNYRSRLYSTASKTENIELRWLHVLFYLRCAITLVLVPMGIISIAKGWIDLPVFQLAIEIASVVFFFIVGYYGFKQTTIFVNPAGTGDGKQPAVYERSGLSNEHANQLHTQLLDYMRTSKAYLQSELNAADLSKGMNISVNHLSQVLNTVQQQNFFDFVNTYRVEEVKKRLVDDRYAHLTILAIALDCGFNSKSAFNTVFKKITGMTPSQYSKNRKSTMQ